MAIESAKLQAVFLSFPVNDSLIKFKIFLLFLQVLNFQRLLSYFIAKLVIIKVLKKRFAINATNATNAIFF